MNSTTNKNSVALFKALRTIAEAKHHGVEINSDLDNFTVKTSVQDFEIVTTVRSPDLVYELREEYSGAVITERLYAQRALLGILNIGFKLIYELDHSSDQCTTVYGMTAN